MLMNVKLLHLVILMQAVRIMLEVIYVPATQVIQEMD